MAKKKEEKPESYLDGIDGNIWASILLAKAEYEKNPSNQLYSMITDLELVRMEIKKLK